MRLDSDARTRYLLDNFGRETALHKKIYEKTESENVLGMQISAYEGQLLQFLARLSGAGKIVEIGCLYGYSALWFLEILPEHGQLFLLEMDAARVEWMRKNFQDHPKFPQVTWLTGDALENLAGIEAQGPFDLCFIDANKGAYSRYLDWAEEHVKKGGLILGDNSFLWGGVYEENPSEKISKGQRDAMKEFNRRLADKSRYLSTLIPTEEGLTAALKLF
jgi:predicted O-methyltransferase YrrM